MGSGSGSMPRKKCRKPSRSVSAIGDGVDQSPPLRWSEPPSGTRSLALICDDPDAPRGTWVHWVLFSLPAQIRELDQGVPTTAPLGNGAKQGKNDFGDIGYGGPAPPKGNPCGSKTMGQRGYTLFPPLKKVGGRASVT